MSAFFQLIIFEYRWVLYLVVAVFSAFIFLFSGKPDYLKSDLTHLCKIYSKGYQDFSNKRLSAAEVAENIFSSVQEEIRSEKLLKLHEDTAMVNPSEVYLKYREFAAKSGYSDWECHALKKFYE